MIDIKKVWIPQIVGYAEIVFARSSDLRDCWVLGQCYWTSVTSFDELIEQVFGDLDSNNLLEDAQIDSTVPEELVKSIRNFLSAIKETDQVNESGEWADVPEALLASAEWQTVIDRAGDLVDVNRRAHAEGYREQQCDQ